jgi:hypothetical protein
VFDGGTIGATFAVGADVAVAKPTVFVAVTATTSVEPTSALVSLYVVAVAPATGMQLAPLESQLDHWYAKDIGVVPDQVPWLADKVCPSWARPEIAGGAAFAGGTAATTPVAAEVAVADPAGLLAVTATTSVEPTSALVNV